jgi:hypothetical protein
MKGKPDISAFLDGAKKESTATKPRPAGRITKTIRLAPDLEQALKDVAYERSKAISQRVTESDVIDEALRKYFNM